MQKAKNIVIISPFFFPEPISTGKFNTDVALKLQEEGHQVTVLCSHPFYPDWKTRYSSEKLEGITIIRGGNKIKYPNKISLRRIVLEIWYALFILKNIKNQFLKKLRKQLLFKVLWKRILLKIMVLGWLRRLLLLLKAIPKSELQSMLLQGWLQGAR